MAGRSCFRKYDSVDCILDKIDAELSLLKPLELPATFKYTTRADTSAKGCAPSKPLINGSEPGQQSIEKGGSVNSLCTAAGSSPRRNETDLYAIKPADKDQGAGSSKRCSELKPLVADSDAAQSEFTITDFASSHEDVDCSIELSDFDNESTVQEDPSNEASLQKGEEGYDTERELKAELTKESTRIQKEIQMERTARAPCALPISPRLGSGIQAKQSYGCLFEDDEDQDNEELHNIDIAKSILEETMNSIREAKQEKLLLLLEVNNLQDTVEELAGTLEQMEQLTMDNRARADETRSQLALAECQKSNLQKDLEKLTAEIEAKQDVHNKVSIRKRLSNGEHNAGDGASHGEKMSDLLDEKNQLIAALEQQYRSVQRERDELEKCIALVNDDLIVERKKSRLKVDTLEEEVESLLHKLDEASTALDEAGARVRSSDSKVQQLHEEKIKCVLERTRECEELKGQSQRDILEVKAYTATELGNMAARHKLDEDKIIKLQEELIRREQAAADTRNQIMNLQQAVMEKGKEKDAASREFSRKLEVLEREKSEEIRHLKESTQREHQQLRQSLQAQLASQSEVLIKKIKQEHSDQITGLQQSITAKDDEITLLKDNLRLQEDSSQKTIATVQAEAVRKSEEAIFKERALWEQECQYLGQQQMAHYREELSKHMEQLREQYESERTLVLQLQQKNNILMKELDDLRHTNVRITQEYQRKLSSASKSKKAVQKELSRELEAARTEWEEERLSELKQLADSLEQKESIIKSLECSQKALSQHENELESLLDKCEYTVVQEVNEECRKTALVLGVTPRKAILTGTRASSCSSSTPNKRSLSRSLISSALANLRACNDELRSHLKETNAANESVKLQLHELQQQQSTEMEKLKARLQREKSADMQQLKEKLAQEEADENNLQHRNGHDGGILLQSNSGWDGYGSSIGERADEKMARHLQIYLKKKEKLTEHTHPSRQHQRLSKGRSSPPSKAAQSAVFSCDESSNTTVSMLKKLQERVKHVYLDAAAHGSNGSSSRCSSVHTEPSDLSSGLNGSALQPFKSASEEYARSLEQRVKVAELQAHLADERGRRYQQLLGQKLRQDADESDSIQSPMSSRLPGLSLSHL